MLVSRTVVTMLSQARLISQLAKYLTLDQSTTDLRGLFKCLAHSTHLLQLFVHLNTLLLQLLTLIDKLLLLGTNSLTFTP